MTRQPEVPSLEGAFASPEQRRRERRWQRAGLCMLIALVVAALCGMLGERGTVVRAAGVYVFLLAVFRVSGRRTLAQVTNFDLILVLIIGDATQQAIIGDDFTMIAGVLAVSTLLLLDVGLSLAKQRWPQVDVVVDGLPLPLVTSGVLRRDLMASEGVSDDDLLIAARESRGLTRLDQISDAVLEASGGITIVPSAGNIHTAPGPRTTP